jgi:hypothetical protein
METKKPARTPQDADKFMLRLPDGLREKVAASAKDNNRSMNAEFIARIEASYEPTLNSLTWIELFKILQTEAQKHGATINISIK